MTKKFTNSGFLVFLFVFCACSAQKLSSPNLLLSQTFETTHQKKITICLGEEPESLYLYSANSKAAKDILQAIYDGPIDKMNGELLPVILEKIPNFADGSAFFTSEEVIKDEKVINTSGELVSLQAGVQVFPTGCTQPNCAVKWDGITPLRMDFITATFELKSNLTWSSGQPLTASDSVYSFIVASDPFTPINKHTYEQTASYIATDDLIVQWTSKPGLVTDSFEKYFWTPLPEYAWGKYSASELLSADEVNHRPLGWGAYQVEEWIDGQSILLVRNPNYFRKDAELPYFDTLVFKFIDSNGDTAISNLKIDRGPFQQFNYDLGDFEKEIFENGCDLVTTSSDMRDQLPVLNILLNYFQNPAIKVIKSAYKEDELILFDLREDAPESSSPLFNLDVRKAVSLCLNREKAIKDLSIELYDQIDSIQFTNKELNSQKKTSITYDPIAGAALLDQVGWKDEDNKTETPRVSAGISGIADGQELNFLYLVEDIEDNLKSSEIVKASLGECGIEINIKAVPTYIFWDASQVDSVFQRDYDLAQLTWAAPITNPCLLFSSQFIPSVENNFLGTNLSGFKNEGFEQACNQLEITHLKADKDALLEKMGSIINEKLPVIPLYRYSKLIIAQKAFCIEGLEMKSDDELAKIEEFNISSDCQ